MLVDVKTIPTTPMGADNLWSATEEGHDSHLETDEPKEEPTALQTQSLDHHEAATYGRKDRRQTSAAGQWEEGQAFGARIGESLKRAEEQAQNQPQAGDSTAGLPPDTIQACARRKEYVI